MRLEFERVEWTFTEPQRTAHGMLRTRELIEVTLHDDEGRVGRGEAAPLESYDDVTIEAVASALESFARVVARRPAGAPRNLLDRCREVVDLPQALAAIDLAIWDLAGKRAERPVCELLSDTPAAQVPVNATIAASELGAAVSAARAAVAAGYDTVKLKVGFDDDLERVRAVREAIGPGASLRLDANAAWSVEQAAALLDRLGEFALELVEEPVHGLEAMADLRRRVPVRIALDESAALPGALTARVADAICLKLARCGGIGGLLAAASLVRASGAEVYIASTYDGPLGIAAALHAAAALAPLPPCGLATLELFSNAASPFPVRGGAIAVPRGPGLGV
ncbi:MAG: mandelate racemase/muconate lactonizing enzyme family protein [Solirubrobacteraceae bacterium]|jgi:L-alanine-DL-glutamate epimerase-like enolase superfamily enzyme